MRDRRQSDRLLRIVAIIGAISGFSNLAVSYALFGKIVRMETRAVVEAKERDERRAALEKWRQDMWAASRIRDDEIAKLKQEVAEIVAAKR